MTWEVLQFHVGTETSRPKTRSLLHVVARGAGGVETMMLLEMFADLLVLYSNMHHAAIPVTRVHCDLGVVVAQNTPINQNGIRPVILRPEHHDIMDHEVFRRAICVHIRSERCCVD